jgi:hypothetical protein
LRKSDPDCLGRPFGLISPLEKKRKENVLEKHETLAKQFGKLDQQSTFLREMAKKKNFELTVSLTTRYFSVLSIYRNFFDLFCRLTRNFLVQDFKLKKYLKK